MNVPRISVGAIMAGLVVVAIDCVAFRSIGARPEGMTNRLFLGVVATLPMANILAVVLSRSAGGRPSNRPKLFGFAAGGLLAMLATVFGLEPGLSRLEVIFQGTALLHWLESSPALTLVALGVVVGVAPLAIQALVAMTSVWLIDRFAPPARPELDLASPPRLHAARAFLTLLVLVAAPAMAIEGYLRRAVDPSTARLMVGSEAVIEADEATQILLGPKASPARGKVRIESDGEPSLIELWALPNGTVAKDRRMVRVTALEGPQAGQVMAFPHCCLKVVR